MTQEPRPSRLRPETPPEEFSEKELSAGAQVLVAETGFLQTLARLAEGLSPKQRAVAMSALSVFLLVSRAEAGIGAHPANNKPDTDISDTDIPAEAEPSTAITPEMRAMHTLLVELQSAGYTLNFLEGYTVTVDMNKKPISFPDPITIKLIDTLQFYLHENGAKLFFTSSPVDKLRRGNVIDLELPDEVRDTSKPIDVPLHQIVVEQTAEGTFILVRNWLTGGTVYRSDILDSRELIMDDTASERYSQSIGASIQEAVRKDFVGVPDQWRTVEEQVGPVEVRPSIYAFNEQVDPVENATEFFAQFEKVKFRAQAHNRPHEDINYRNFELNADIIEGTKQHPLKIHNASLQNIELHRSMPIDTDTTPQLIVDSYGNVIQKIYYFVHHKNEAGDIIKQPMEVLLIYPQQQFSDQAGPETELYPINLDLSALGLGRLENYVHQPIERPVFTSENGAYNFYTTMDHTAVRELYGDRLEQAAQGVGVVEELYGIVKGTAVRQIMVVDSQSPNAQYNFANPEAIVLFDEVLTEQATTIVAMHETQHRFSTMLGLDVDSSLVELHAGLLSSQFFRALDEDNWFEGNLQFSAGHSSDNVSEMLSSFHNTLLDPQWQRKIESATVDVRESYQRVLLVLQSALTKRIASGDKPTSESATSTPVLTAEAPIFRVLQEKIDFLDKHAK